MSKRFLNNRSAFAALLLLGLLILLSVVGPLLSPYSYKEQLKNEKGEIPEIPDYAIDMHTNKGRFELGRDVFYFLNEASKVEPLWEGYDDTYWKQLYKMYEEEEKEKKE